MLTASANGRWSRADSSKKSLQLQQSIRLALKFFQGCLSSCNVLTSMLLAMTIRLCYWNGTTIQMWNSNRLYSALFLASLLQVDNSFRHDNRRPRTIGNNRDVWQVRFWMWRQTRRAKPALIQMFGIPSYCFLFKVFWSAIFIGLSWRCQARWLGCRVGYVGLGVRYRHEHTCSFSHRSTAGFAVWFFVFCKHLFIIIVLIV